MDWAYKAPLSDDLKVYPDFKKAATKHERSSKRIEKDTDHL